MANIPPPPVNQQPSQPPPAVIQQWQRNANALGLNTDETILYELMVNFLNFTEDQYVSLRTQGGYGRLQDLNQWRYKEIKDWCTSMSNRPPTRGGRTYGDLKVKQLQGIAWWVTDCSLRNLPLDVDIFKANADDYRANAEYEYRESEADDISIDKPAKFEYKNWIAWEESVYMYFDSITNLKGAPLSYVIRKDLVETADLAAMTRKEQIIYNSPLTGFVFNLDSKTVLSIIKECTLDSDAETWIKNIRCGREAMKILQKHYDGPDEARKRLDAAKSTLDRTFYRHEATFSFEKYVTTLNGIYKIHERYNEPIYESDKVRYLLDKCQNNHVEFKQAVMMCRTLHDTFEGAITYLKIVVGRLFADVGKGIRKRHIAEFSTKKGGSNNKNKVVNGVDCSDLTRWYSNEEFKKLPGYMRKKIAQNKSHQHKNKNQIQKHKKAKISAVEKDNEGGGTADDSSQRLVAAMINGVMNATRHEISASGSVQYPHNGRNASIAAAQQQQRRGNGLGSNPSSNDSNVSVVTFDHLGNPL